MPSITGRVSSIDGLLNNDTCENIKFMVEDLEVFSWSHVLGLDPVRAVGDASADYYRAGPHRMTARFYDFLQSLAPSYPDAWLQDIVINKYEPGQFLGEHIDVHEHSKNLIIALDSNPDQGLMCEGIWYPDVAGRGLLMEGRTPPHHVPAVTQLRYTLIFLYE